MIKRNKYVVVDRLDEKASPKLRRRLLELGFTRGQKLRVRRKSILGQTYLVEIRGYILTLRKNIMQFVVVRE